MITALIAASLLCHKQPSLLHPKTVSVSFGKVEITSPELLPLGGYTARQGKVMEGGGEPLYARCVLYSADKWRMAVVSAEMLTIPDSLAREVRKKIPAGIQLFLCATHTHSAPDSQMLNDRMTFSIPGIATFKRRWLDWYSDRIASSVLDAAKEQTLPANVGEISQSTFTEALNRGRRKGAEPDPAVTMVYSGYSFRPRREGTRTLYLMRVPLFASYAAHAVLLGPENNKTSGDWPGKLSQLVEAESKVPFLYLPAAIGDVSPRSTGKSQKDQVEIMASTIFHDSQAIRPHSVWRRGGPIQSILEPIKLDPTTPHPNFGKDYKIPQALAQILALKFAPREAAITAFRLGSLAFVGVPGEPTSHLGRRIKDAGKKMGFENVLVVSHVNGWIGYILDPMDYDNGGYEADLSFYGRQEGEHVVEAAIDALRKLR